MILVGICTSIQKSWINHYLVQKFKTIISLEGSIERSNPIKGTVYIDGSHTMPLNRVVLLTDYWNHGGLIYIRLQYSVNGKSRTDDVSYYVYR